MNRIRAGIALPAALAAVIVLSALAALSSVAARAALREAAALAAEAQAQASRAALRARASLVLARVSRSDLLAGPRAIGERDTTLTVVAVVWPWHRVLVWAGDAPAVAELARATAPALPWCAAVVVAGSSAIAPNTVSIDPASSCTELTTGATESAVAAFGDSLAGDLVLPPPPDSMTVYAGAPPAVIRARRFVGIAPGASVAGVVIAPSVRVETGATVRGIIIASESLAIAPGAAVIGDEYAANAALFAASRLRLLGRAGLLLPP